MHDDEDAIGQHRAIGTLLLSFGTGAFIVGFIFQFVLESELGFFTPTDLMLIALTMVLVGDVLRRWRPT